MGVQQVQMQDVGLIDTGAVEVCLLVLQGLPSLGYGSASCMLFGRPAVLLKAWGEGDRICSCH